MPIIDQNDLKKVKEYQEFVSSVSDTHFIQDPRWAKVHHNLKAEFVTVVDAQGKITEAATVYVRPIAMGYSLLYVNRGPVSPQHDLEAIHEIICEIRPLVAKYKAFAIRFDPNWQYDEKEEERFKTAGLKIRGKGFSKRDLVMSRRSMVFYLKDRTFDQIMSMFRIKTRRNVNKSLRNGLTLEEGFTKEHLDVFMKILEETAIRDGIEHRPREFFELIAQNFSHDEARLYLAKKDDEYLAGTVGMNYAGHLYYYHSGSTGRLRNLLPNYFLQHALINWAVDSHCHTYDMGGIISEDISDGLYQFKIGFCNEEGLQEYYGEIDYPTKPLIYKGFIIAYGMLQKHRSRQVAKAVKQKQQEEKHEEDSD